MVKAVISGAVGSAHREHHRIPTIGRRAKEWRHMGIRFRRLEDSPAFVIDMVAHVPAAAQVLLSSKAAERGARLQKHRLLRYNGRAQDTDAAACSLLPGNGAAFCPQTAANAAAVRTDG